MWSLLSRATPSSSSGQNSADEPDELEESIQWEAEQYILDINDVNIDVQILEGAAEDPGQMDVLLVAARKELVNEYQSLITQAGLRAAVVDVDAFAVANMFQLNYDVVGQTVALVNIGASNDIHVLRDGVSAFTRDVGLGGRQFTEEIQRTLNISYEAEAMKVGGDEHDRGAVVPEEIEQVLASVSDSLATEIQRSSTSTCRPPPTKGLARCTSPEGQHEPRGCRGRSAADWTSGGDC